MAAISDLPPVVTYPFAVREMTDDDWQVVSTTVDVAGLQDLRRDLKGGPTRKRFAPVAGIAGAAVLMIWAVATHQTTGVFVFTVFVALPFYIAAKIHNRRLIAGHKHAKHWLPHIDWRLEELNAPRIH